jgi:hypothetical protein
MQVMPSALRALASLVEAAVRHPAHPQRAAQS